MIIEEREEGRDAQDVYFFEILFNPNKRIYPMYFIGPQLMKKERYDARVYQVERRKNN